MLFQWSPTVSLAQQLIASVSQHLRLNWFFIFRTNDERLVIELGRFRWRGGVSGGVCPPPADKNRTLGDVKAGGTRS